ncbi:hypothetical protein MTBLM1_40167 [Rhodospirillaceae bacterium LM-1]|nr:hypothetical protein MTBLM1_40167 [Rhodospirillaceae bacterium LM-1]
MNESVSPRMTERLTTSAQELIRTTQLFSEIERDGVISQESLYMRLGGTPGLTNAADKRCVRNGLIRVQKCRCANFLTSAESLERTHQRLGTCLIPLAFSNALASSTTILMSQPIPAAHQEAQAETAALPPWKSKTFRWSQSSTRVPMSRITPV